MKLYIRNMACESCKVVVKDTLTEMKLKPTKVSLGEADIKEKMTDEQKEKFNKKVKKVGMEIIEKKSGVLIEQIKDCVRKYVFAAQPPRLNLSDYLSRELGYEYNYLSNIFRAIEAMTIIGYANAVRIERAKEMILLEDHTFAQIAKKLHYATLSYFSVQFKKATGVSPSQFKKQNNNKRMSIQELTP